MQYTTKDVYEFISKQTNDPILEWKTCAVSGAEFPIYKSDMEFYDKISPSFGGKKYQIPTPTLCPEERQRRRLLFRNERKLYKRKCDASGKDIISIYAPDAPYKVYDQKFRWSDDWNPLDYGREFDFSRSFREQFGELMREVPRFSLYNPGAENSDYANISVDAKNCYLAFVSSFSENILYSHWAIYCKNSMDLYRCSECEDSYQINGGVKTNTCSFSFDLSSCHDCHYSVNLVGCSSCFLCKDLVNKSFCIENQQYSKEEYETKLKQYTGKEEAIFALIFGSHIRPSLKNYGGENVIGNGNFYGNNLVLCSNLDEGKDCRYYDEGAKGIESCMDCNYGKGGILCYESVSPLNGYHCISIFFSTNTKYSLYSSFCFESEHCFACVGLRNKEYCILNKQYTKEEYETLVPKIIEHMQNTGERGEFFHPSLSPFGYNETIASEYFPLTREEALARGYTRQDNTYDPIIPEGADTIQGNQIPTDITSVSDDILKKIFICEVSGRPFRIIKQELEFYRKHTLPLPRKHPDVRHQERMGLRPARQLHLRHCDKCSKEMLSVYPQEYQGKVYCEECYTKEIY